MKERVIHDQNFKIDKTFYFQAMQWLKWLSYESTAEMERKKDLYVKPVNRLTSDDLKTKCWYKKCDYITCLLEKYIYGNCSREELEMITSYMKKPIFDLMLEKLSLDELNEAFFMVKQLQETLADQLKDKIQEWQANYTDISMIEAFVFHMLTHSTNIKRKIRRKEQR